MLICSLKWPHKPPEIRLSGRITPISSISNPEFSRIKSRFKKLDGSKPMWSCLPERQPLMIKRHDPDFDDKILSVYM